MTVWEEGLVRILRKRTAFLAGCESDGDEIFGKGIKEDELDEAENRRWVGQWRWVEDDRTSKPIEDRRKDLTTESIKVEGRPSHTHTGREAKIKRNLRPEGINREMERSAEKKRTAFLAGCESDGDEIFGKGIKEDELDELSDRVPTHSKDNTVRHDKKDTQQYRTGHETGHEETGKTHMTGQGM
ncbi:hypothetical protein BY996DRAFT_6499507 [Phakopsora pachyrhizi]|nr:hypothetical protein BY996DRAFT_6499507 [Phakopsora pachyrhizi]